MKVVFTGDHDILSRERKAAIQVALGVNIEGNRIPFEVAYIAVSKKGEDVGEIVISFSICEEDGDNILDWGEEIKDLLGDNIKITLLGNDSTKSDVIINVTTDGEFKEEDKEFIGRPTQGIENAVELAEGNVIINIDEVDHYFSENYTCPDHGFSFPEINPRLFSFNAPFEYLRSASRLSCS